MNNSPSMESTVVRTVTLRLMPLLVLLYLVAYVDRSNVGFAKLTLQDELGLSNAAFTLGQVAFFVAYALFEVPSNVFLERVGARRWFTRIMVTWGLVTVLTALVQSGWQFYAVRFLLGLAEAGFYPGVLYFLTKWYPFRHRARMTGWFMMSQPLAFILGNPLLGALDDMDGVLGLKGWQWIFVATGIPAVLLGALTLRVLPDGPEKVRWLTDAQRGWIAGELAAESRALGDAGRGSTFATLRDKRVVLMSLFYLCFPLGAYGLSFWLPTIVDGFGGLTTTQTGFITAVPYLFVALGLWAVPKLAQRGSPYAWVAGTATLGALALAGSAMVEDHLLQMTFISVAALGIFAGQPVLMALPSRFLTGVRAAAGIAMINAVGNLGGGFGPMGIGVIVDRTGSAVAGLWFLVAALALAAATTYGIKRLIERGPLVDRTPDQPPTVPDVASTPEPDRN